MNQYKALKDKQDKVISSFPFLWAFSQEQFDEGMRKLHLDPTETDKMMSIGNGGYIRRADLPALKKMFARHKAEQSAAIAADTDGTGFVYDMFLYELDNHEYCYTGDATEALEALGLSWQEVQADKRLSDALNRAIKAINAREVM